jgi:hypothetical protein
METTMARPFQLDAPRVRAARWAGQAAELVIFLALFSLVALWVTGAPVASLLPLPSPA